MEVLFHPTYCGGLIPVNFHQFQKLLGAIPLQLLGVTHLHDVSGFRMSVVMNPEAPSEVLKACAVQRGGGYMLQHALIGASYLACPRERPQKRVVGQCSKPQGANHTKPLLWIWIQFNSFKIGTV